MSDHGRAQASAPSTAVESGPAIGGAPGMGAEQGGESPPGVLTEETRTNETRAPGRAWGKRAREGVSSGSLLVKYQTERK
jgi:hypothetical protein